jgi:TolB-like protein/Tfp pilus assembly protein PilF
MSLLRELNRRNVFRVATLYAVASWVLLQVAGLLFPMLSVPDWGQRLVFGLLLLGFPLAVVVAWVYELTPEGLKRSRDVQPGSAANAAAGRRLDQVTIGLVLLAIGLIVADRFMPGRATPDHAAAPATDVSTPSTAQSGAAAAPTERSIAVLPFVNLSGDPADEYFSDGLAEELLNSLTRIDGLKVAARTTSFQYKDRTGDVADIARQLRVAHVLEGSVRRSGSRVRITAQLIKAEDGFHLWSESYDRELEDIFEVQSDIAGRIAEKLRVELSPRPTTSDAAALDLLLRARHLMRQRNEPALRESRKLLEQALDHDPKYAAAWSALATVLTVLPSYASARVQPEETLESAEKAARRAIDVDPGMAEPLTLLAYLHEVRGDWIEADRLYDKAVSLDPEDPTSQFWRANNLSRAGYQAEARVHRQRALALDPTNGAIHMWLAAQLGADGEFESALAAVAKAEELGAVRFADFNRGLIHFAQGDRPGAVERWNRYFEGQSIRTRAPQLLVEAVDDPRRRPAALAAIDDLPPDEFVFTSSIVLGDADRALRVVEGLSRGTDVMDNVIWWDLARPVRQTAEFRRLVRALGLEELWRARGWPDKCRTKGAGDFVCD